ncbi:calcium-binding protein [Tistrella mobilis]|uniref:calcium-binding protein n=1 Tax=Tistrella mobilis TaxID=171437 RepID=UPI0031F67124
MYVSIEHFNGGMADDTFIGSSRSDILYGQDGNDHIEGAGGDDLLSGGSGGDHIDGGLGFDIVYYVPSPMGVNVDLLNGTASGGHADGDFLVSIEGVHGSYNYDDFLYGDDMNNTFSGRGGDDVIDGRGGSDTIRGGLGSDQMTGGDAADRFIFDILEDSGVDLIDQDRLLDFAESEGDRIDFRTLAADIGPLSYVGTAAFSGSTGEIRSWASSVLGFTHVGLDADGDAMADMILLVAGNPADITAAAFLL